jgi:hypothetical protein
MNRVRVSINVSERFQPFIVIPLIIQDDRVKANEDIPCYYYSKFEILGLEPKTTSVVLHFHAGMLYFRSDSVLFTRNCTLGGNTAGEPANATVR